MLTVSWRPAEFERELIRARQVKAGNAQKPVDSIWGDLLKLML